LKSIEDHIRLKNPEKHKAKLLELIQNEGTGDCETRMIKTSPSEIEIPHTKFSF
jgi:hypothetical protein